MMKHDIITYTWLSPLVRRMKKSDEIQSKDLAPLASKFLPATNGALIGQVL